MTRRQAAVLATASAASFMVYLDVTVVTVALPSMRESYPGASISDLSWVLNAYSVVFAALLVAAGRLGDRWGRARTFETSLPIFVLASAACAAAPSAEVLIAARVAQAAAGALLVPNAQALLMAEFPAAKRALAVGLFGGAAAVATAAGPSLGGLLVESTSWRWVFLLNLPVGGAAMLAAVRLLTRERADAGAPWPDMAGVALATGGVGLLTLGLVEGQEWGWGSGRIVGAFVAGSLLVPAFLWRSARHPAPVVDLSLFRIRTFAVANAASFVFAVAFFGLLFSCVLFFGGVWGYSPLEVGLALTPAPLLAAIVAGPAGRLTDLYGPRVVTIPGAAAFAAGAAWTALAVDGSPDYVGSFLPAGLLAGIGVGLSAPALNSAAVARLPAERFGVGSGINGMMRQLGSAVGVAAVVAILGAGDSVNSVGLFHEVWWLCAAAGLAAATIAVALPR